MIFIWFKHKGKKRFQVTKSLSKTKLKRQEKKKKLSLSGSMRQLYSVSNHI